MKQVMIFRFFVVSILTAGIFASPLHGETIVTSPQSAADKAKYLVVKTFGVAKASANALIQVVGVSTILAPLTFTIATTMLYHNVLTSAVWSDFSKIIDINSHYYEKSHEFRAKHYCAQGLQ